MIQILNNRTFKTLVLLFAITIIAAFFSPKVSGVSLLLFLTAAYYEFVFYVLKVCEINIFKTISEEKIKISLILLFFTGLILFQVLSSHTIRIWDSLEVWEPALRSRELVLNNAFDAIKELFHSINHYDYNNVVPMLVTLPMLLFGKSFAAYVFSVWLFFAVPAALIAAAGVKKFLEKFNFSPSVAVVFFVTLLIPTYEFALINGYANVSIILPGALITILLLSSSEEELDIKKTVLTAVLAVIAVLQARTAAYMVVACFTGYGAYILYSGLTEGNLKKKLLILLKKYVCMFVVCMAILLIFFNNFVRRAFLYDIKTAYVAYTLGQDYLQRLMSQIVFFGIVPCGIYLVSLIVGLKNKICAKFAVFSVVWVVVSVCMFCRIQVMGQQHQYIMLLPAALAIALFVVYIMQKNKKIAIATLVLLTVNFCNAYSGFLPSIFGPVYIADNRGDIEDLKKIVADLNSVTKDTDKKIYFIASSGAYNYGTLQKINMPDSLDATHNLLWTPDVDLRDGFSAGFLDADIIALIDPVQTHLLPEYQKTIIFPFIAITTDTPISKHYREIKNYRLTPYKNTEVNFRVYEKISPLTKSDVEFLERYYVDSYPDQDKLFKDVFERYKSERFKEGGN